MIDFFRWIVTISLLFALVLAFRGYLKTEPGKRKLAFLGIAAALLALLGHIGLWVIDVRDETANKIQPYLQKITTAECDISLIVAKNTEVGSGTYHYGAMCAFGKGQETEPLLLMSTNQYIARADTDTSTYIAFTARMLSVDSVFCDRVLELAESDYFTLALGKIPEDLEVFSGQARVLLNGDCSVVIDIPAQHAEEGFITSWDLNEAFAGFPTSSEGE